MNPDDARPSLLITGAAGYIGRITLMSLVEHSECFRRIVALDIRQPDAKECHEEVIYLKGDVRDSGLAAVMAEHKISTVIHLASIVSPGKKHDRDFEYSVDVLGTRNVLDACVKNGVRHLVLTSSGAAYGYYADNPQPLDEEDAIRGNPEFSYSDHKRQIEEMLAAYRHTHPELKQLIFRPGTVLGKGTRNQITDIFDKPVITGLSGCETPFVFIWDEDVAACIVKGVLDGAEGIYNLAGEGTISLREIARLLRKPYIPIPIPLLRITLSVLRCLKATQYGPEQIDFLRYRPVLSNRRLKQEFGYIPRRTSRETFLFFMQHR